MTYKEVVIYLTVKQAGFPLYIICLLWASIIGQSSYPKCLDYLH